MYLHLPHIEKSLHTGRSVIGDPARCLDCGFIFKKRDRHTTPGRCPVCRSEAIQPPVYCYPEKLSRKNHRIPEPANKNSTSTHPTSERQFNMSGAIFNKEDSDNICEFEEDHLIPEQEKRIRNVIEAMVRSCSDDKTVDHVGAALIPSKDEIIRILGILQDVLFPGFFGRQELSASTLEYHLGYELTELYEALSAQLSRSIRHECRRTDSLCVKCIQKGREEAVLFMEKLPDLRWALSLDVKAHFDGDPAAKSLDEIVFSYPGLYAIFVYRVAHELFLRNIPLMPRIMTEHAHSLTGIDINPGATIGKEFFIDHGTGVVIGETTYIGDRVRIYQGVTLGALSVPRGSEGGNALRGRKRHPTIEDDVTIYAQATILGGDTVIGARSVIGGNVWLTSSAPPDTTVLIEPPTHVFKADRDK
ncbi:MAG: serine O-acetyltransferase EpsC [Desulfomonilaceae bacterium]